jgi:DNA-binding beta-propeller fold protein YncE
LGSHGTGNDQYYGPDSVEVASSNNVYVIDIYNSRVVEFDGSGNYLTQWGSYGIGNGQFNHPSVVAVDSSNNVYVADYANNRIEKFTRNGNLECG